MKQRFSALDVSAITAELKDRLLGCRLNNIYDLNARTFLLKFGKQDVKESVIIESGARVHATKFQRNPAPLSGFVTKLRKHLKSRRLTNLYQLRSDRVVVFTFGGGENDSDPAWTYYLVCEFFAAGNILLLDGSFKILSLLRVVTFDKNQFYAVGQRYDLNDALTEAQRTISMESLSLLLDQITEQEKAVADVSPTNEEVKDTKKSNKSKKPKVTTLRKALTIRLGRYGNALIEHCIRLSQLDPLMLASDFKNDEEKKKELLEAFHEADKIMNDATKPPIKGYIFGLQQDIIKSGEETGAQKTEQVLMYEDFHPFKPLQLLQNNNRTCIEFPSYNECVDEFFSSLESQKIEKQNHDRLKTFAKRIENAKRDVENKLKELQKAQELSEKKAQAIELNPQLVEGAIEYVNSLVGQAMDWLDIEKLITVQQRRQHAFASVIRLPLQLKKNLITLVLPDPNPLAVDEESEQSESESDSEPESTIITPVQRRLIQPKGLAVEVDLALGAFANARVHYNNRRLAALKEEKTIESSSKAIKNTQKRAEADLKTAAAEAKQALTASRRTFFFEKFHWFISSDGYLVLGGRDNQQRELLYEKYCNKGDVYVSADLPNSSSVIIKNRNENDPIPPNTLQQAGALALATSKAWDTKTVISAWWVPIHAVSKVDQTKQILPTGHFWINEEKNYLPPTNLVMGYGILWFLDEVSARRRREKRILRDEMMSQVSEDMSNVSIASSSAPSVASESQTSLLATTEPTTNLLGREQQKVFKEQKPSRKAKKTVVKAPSAKERREARKLRRQQALQESLKKPTTLEDASDPQTILALLKESKKKKKRSANAGSTSDASTPTSQDVSSIEPPSSATTEFELVKEQEPVVGKEELPAQQHEKQAERTRVLVDMPTQTFLSAEQLAEVNEARDYLSPELSEKDKVLYAVPIFMPYSGMNKFTYKIKIQPGSAKVGKTSREVIEYFKRSMPKKSPLLHALDALKDSEISAPVYVSRLKAIYPQSAKKTSKSKGSKK
ncbi:DUF814 family protein [Schizosaccharomyces japonicus yFS275]|uniref:Ribosome quality control complex subunit 2 n=1 Tax=Schizosaccharomyces japonicus (strain yFS275 / FY16936) TaxID=402676 RepID=B6JXE6_SCHJY|nr:DUF814 family protein [Schizosaccharomyces japonicus yFS275]EEB06047.1 DUF814 family protein [Schizosaccharomyces japonicus yFS275]